MRLSSMETIKRVESIREKLETKGVRALSDEELLVLLISDGKEVQNIDDICTHVLSIIDKGISFPLSALMNIPGVGRIRGARLLAAMEFGRRKTNRKPRQYNHHQDIYQEIRHFASREQEQLIVLSMNAAFEILHIHCASTGFINKAFFHPREIFSEAIKHHAVQIVIAHNHPSGRVVPSKEDILATKRIVKSGEVLGIPVVDHIIFTLDSYSSFVDSGIMSEIMLELESEKG